MQHRFLILTCMLLVPVSLFGQRRSQGARSYGKNPAGLAPDQMKAAIAEFNGKLRNFDKKQIMLDTYDGQLLIFRRTKSTQFVGKDGAKSLDLGVPVQVEAMKETTGDLAAVRICEDACKSSQTN